MHFGDDEFFNKMYEAFNENLPSNAAIYTEIAAIVKLDTEHIMREKLPGDVNYENREDALQEIYDAVFKKLPLFLTDSVNRTPAERQGWLKSIARNKIANIADSSFTRIETMDIFGNTETVSVSKTDSFDVEDFGPEPSAHEYTIDNMYLNKFAKEEYVDVFTELLNLRVKPDRLMSFFYAKIIIPYNEGRYKGNTVSGYPELAYKKLSGQRMGDIVKAFPRDFQKALDMVFPAEMFKVLDKRMSEVSDSGVLWKDMIFNLDYKAVIDASNRLHVRLKQIWEKNKKIREGL